MHAAREVAELAGAIALRHFRSSVAVEWKADGSPVTAADREAERAAREWIGRRFPDDGIVGEEFGVVNPDARRRWLVDPIDGTKSFMRGVPMWGTLIAVADGDAVIAGAASFPALGETLVAGRELGCWCNGARARVSATSDISRAAVLTTDEQFPRSPERREGWRALAQRAALARSWGDCYGYLLVATGRAEVMVDAAMADWDSAALMPIITEAGGVFTDWDGRATAFGGSAIATNAALASDARTLLGVQRGERFERGVSGGSTSSS